MSYPFVAAWWDYGARKGPALGLCFHMAEGGGTVGYLDKNGSAPPRGVSVHTVCDYAGVVTQMLSWSHASGSLNPADRSTNKAYFGHSSLVAVLGAWWTDPNSAVLSMEIEGFAAKGPNPAQVKAAIAWGLDMRRQFSTLRGAIGHADQTDTKGCPGTTVAMKAIFAGVGGHGLFGMPPAPIPVPLPDTSGDAMNGYPVPSTPSIGTIASGVWLYDNSALQPSAGNVQVSPGRDLPYLGQPSSTYKIVEYVNGTGVHSGKCYFVKPLELTNIRALPTAPVTDCAQAVAKALTPVNAELATTKVALTKAQVDRADALDKASCATQAEHDRLRNLLGI